MGAYSEVYGVLCATTEEAADEIRNVLVEGGYLDAETKSKWASENGGETPKRGRYLVLNGGEMKNIVRMVERILETFADSIDKRHTLLRGKKFDGDFALYEFDGTGLREFDDKKIKEVVPGFSWEKWEEGNLDGTTIVLEEEAEEWLCKLAIASVVEQVSKASDPSA